MRTWKRGLALLLCLVLCLGVLPGTAWAERPDDSEDPEEAGYNSLPPTESGIQTTSSEFNISDRGVNFICEREGFHSTCYRDNTQSSIGYGTKCTGSSEQPHAAGTHSTTQDAALAEMKSQINSKYAPRVRNQTVGIEMNQNQFDALVSLCYNCGGGTNLIANSPLVKYLKGELTEEEAREAYSSYIVYSGGQVSQGLVNRRNAEADLFFEATNSTITEEQFAAKIANLKSRYREGEYWSWNNGTLDQTGANKCNNSNTTCGGFYNPVSKTGQYNTDYRIAGQCYGYALRMAYEVFGSNYPLNQTTWERKFSVSDLYAGDHIRLGSETHSIFVTKVEGDTVTYTDCNKPGNCVVHWERTRSKSSLINTINGNSNNFVEHVKGSTLRGTGTPPFDVEISVSTTRASSHTLPQSATSFPKGTSVYINGSISGVTVTDVIFYITEPGGSEQEVCADHGVSYSSYFWMGSGQGTNGYTLSKVGTYHYRIRLYSGSYYKDFSNTIISTASFSFAMNSNGGSGNMSGFTVNFGNNFTIPANRFTRQGYTFTGWNVRRDKDNKWHVPGGWYTESEIASNGYTKSLYPDKKQLTFDDSWTNGYDGVSSYTFFAIWAVIHVSGVTLNKPSLTLNQGASETLTATVTPSNALDKSVTWSSSNTSVATVSNGKVTAVGGGTATITVKTNDGGKTATCAVTVKVPVTGVTLNKTSLTLNKGASETLTATVSPSDATDKSVTWSSSNTSVATVSNGKVTAVGGGTATITVKTNDGGKTATCAVTVKVPVTGVTLNKTSMSIVQGNTETLYATILPTDATNQNMTWTSSNEVVATVHWGVVTAVSPGTATITVITADGGKTATCSVTVTTQLTIIYNSNGATTIKLNGEVINESTLTNTPHTISNSQYLPDGLWDGDNVNWLYLEKNGYTMATHSWNTHKDGTGASVSWSQSFVTGADLANALGLDLSSDNKTVTLYAEWQPNTYTITYNANGGTGAPAAQTKTLGQPLTISGTRPTREGYTFLGWAENASATTAQYQPNGQFTKDANTTLYAVWEINTYTITTDGNGGSGNPTTFSVTYGEAFNYPTNTFTNTGYSFTGWTLRRDADGKWYSMDGGWLTEEEIASTEYSKALYQENGNDYLSVYWIMGYSGVTSFTFFAQWQKNDPVTYTITYDANGGTGAPAAQTKTQGQPLTLSSTRPIREGYTFLGWAENASVTAAQYQPNEQFTKDANTTLYAVWTANPTPSDRPTISIASVNGAPGTEICVPISIRNNTGIAGMTLSLHYPAALILISIENGNALSSLTYSKPGDLRLNPISLVWDGQDEDSTNGTLLTLNFKIPDIMDEGDYDISLSYTYGDIFNGQMDNIDIYLEDGSIRVGKVFVYGDVNDDSVINTKDITLIRRYLAGGYDTSGFVPEAADVNVDGVINTKDITLIRRFLAGGYGVILGIR